MVYGKGGPYGSKSKRRVIRFRIERSRCSRGPSPSMTNSASCGRSVRTIANRASISRPVSPHVLRHTFRVTAVQKGISLPALQRLLGRDRLATTEIYLNLSPEHVIQEFMDKWYVVKVGRSFFAKLRGVGSALQRRVS